MAKVKQALQDVRQVTAGDGIRVNTLNRVVNLLYHQVKTNLGACPAALEEIKGILEVFPALVLPVELREESTVLNKLKKNQTVGAIGRMIRKAAAIAEGGEICHYVQGLIISMTQSIEDLEAALDLTERLMGSNRITIIPLFERGEDLEKATQIMHQALSQKLPLSPTPDKVEIMLGYSDTAKRMGTFASRQAIHQTMKKLVKVCKKHNIQPVFFHGSGGSVTRGGGSIKEQVPIWPKEAQDIIKLTLQGEMVERTLVTGDILRRNVEMLLQAVNGSSTPTVSEEEKTLQKLAALSEEAFHQLVGDSGFRRFMATVTAYPDLNILHIGSRPSHRPDQTQESDLTSLRAIPWVLCFTQTRFLVPSWYGIGSAFQQLCKNPEDLALLKKVYQSNQAFSGYIKLMGFSLIKGSAGIFSVFSHQLGHAPEFEEIKNRLLEEEARVATMVKSLSGEESLLWFRPWLAESIRLRSSAIHPLSLLSLIALKNRRQGKNSPDNDNLLRETIAGVAIGMLTTG